MSSARRAALSPVERAVLRRIRAQGSPWIGLRPAVHPFTSVLKALNPARSTFDCAVRTLTLLRNSAAGGSTSRRRVRKAKTASKRSLVGKGEGEGEGGQPRARRGPGERRYNVNVRRGLLPGEAVAAELYDYPEALTAVNLRRLWAEKVDTIRRLVKGEISSVNDDQFAQLVQQQFPQLDYLSALELWAKVKDALTCDPAKDLAHPGSAAAGGDDTTAYRDLTLKITARDPDSVEDDDLTADVVEMLQRVQQSAVVKVSDALHSAFRTETAMTKEQVDQAVERVWSLPETEFRYSVDPNKMYGYVLQDYMKDQQKAHEQRRADYNDLDLDEDEDHEEDLIFGDPNQDFENFGWRVVGTTPEIIQDIQLAHSAYLDAISTPTHHMSSPPVMYSRATHVNQGHAVVRLQPSLYHRDTWVDHAPKPAVLSLLYGSAGATVPSTLPPSSTERQGGGRFTINGEGLPAAVPFLQHREQLLRPFDYAGVDYRDWAVKAETEGRGTASRARLTQLAVARGLAAYLGEAAMDALGRADLLRDEPRKRWPRDVTRYGARADRKWRKR